MIPYIIMLLLCGLPLLFMELSMGQYTRRGPIGAIGKMCPLFQVGDYAGTPLQQTSCPSLFKYVDISKAYILVHFYDRVLELLPSF